MLHRLLMLAPLAALLGGALPAQATLPRTVAVQGHVLDLLGHGIPAAEVRVTGPGEELLGRSVSDGEGLFRVGKLPIGTPLRLSASAGGHADGAVDLQPGGDLLAANLTLDDAVALRGTVKLADGAPAAAAAVVAVSLRAPLRHQRVWRQDVVADAQGAFVLPAVPVPGVVLAAWRSGCELQTLEVETVADCTCGLVLPPSSATPRRVTVDGLGDGAASVHVSCRDRSQALPLPLPLRRLQVEGGEAWLWPLPCRHEVAVVAEGFRSRPELIPCAADSEGELRFVLTPLPADLLSPATTVTGRVVDALGRPLAGVRVRFAALNGPCVGEVESDAEGGFTAAVPVRARVYCRFGLAPGPLRLGADNAELGTDGITWLGLPADPGRPIVLAALPAATVGGTARDGRDAPLGFARVELSARGPSGNLRLVTATDAGGRFSVAGLPAGEWQAVVDDGRGRRGTAAVAVPAGGRAEFPGFEIAASGEVVGRVVDEAGKPLPGVDLRAVQLRQRLPPGMAERIGSAAVARTDRTGRFRITGLPPAE